jgi:hypothetical protein
LIDYFNKKHIDYIGEKEIRGISFSTEEFNYLPVFGSLVGIVGCFDKLEKFHIHYLNEYCKKHDIEFLNIHWHDHYYYVDRRQDRENDITTKSEKPADFSAGLK